MRTRAVLLASAASAAALMGGWQLGAVATATLTPTASTADAGSSGGGTSTQGTSTQGGASASDATTGAASASQTATGAADGSYTGTTVSTRFGDVQVQVTVSGGAITEVTALQLTDHDGRSVQISNRAAPVLRSEVLQAQSAQVSFVSGATYTSAAYLQSLQAALDQAGF